MTVKRTTVEILAEGLVFTLKVLVVLVSTAVGYYLAWEESSSEPAVKLVDGLTDPSQVSWEILPYRFESYNDSGGEGV